MKKSKSGSTFVEAAILFPLVILLIVGIVNTSLSMHASVAEDRLRHEHTAFSRYTPFGCDMGALMRGKWSLK